MQANEKLYLNGIDAETGQYLVPPITIEDAGAMLKAVDPAAASGRAPTELWRRPPDPAVASWLRRIWRVLSLPHLGLPLGVDPAIVAAGGLGDRVSRGRDRCCQAGARAADCSSPETGRSRPMQSLEYRQGEARGAWLARHGSSAGSVDPLNVPYYLLLVGGPERFPFPFCHQLDVEYAVGCLEFDTPAEYERYARSIVDYETSASVPTGREACSSERGTIRRRS